MQTSTMNLELVSEVMCKYYTQKKIPRCLKLIHHVSQYPTFLQNTCFHRICTDQLSCFGIFNVEN